MSMRRMFVSLTLLSAFLIAGTTAQEKETEPGGPPEFKALKYRLIGPAAGGRVSRVAGVPGDPATAYAATGRHVEADLRRSANLPQNPDEVWFPQVPLLRSIDGGKTTAHVKGPHHGDHHDIWIDPLNPKRVISANDGGVDLSTNGGETWGRNGLEQCAAAGSLDPASGPS